MRLLNKSKSELVVIRNEESVSEIYLVRVRLTLTLRSFGMLNGALVRP